MDLKKAMIKITELEEELKSTRDGYEEEIATLVEKNDDLKKKLKVFIGLLQLEEKTKITTMEERRSIAVHEGGHAVVSWHLQYTDPLVKVTIVPRGNALGAAHYLPEERQIMPTQALLDKLCSLLGGRAAEEKFLGCISTGAMNDLERATNMAYAIVVYYGMSERLPNISYYDSTGQNYGFTKPYSEERARVIDEEVSRIIAEQYERAKEILSQHEVGHRELTDVLLTREVIFTDDVERIFGKRPWHSRTEEIMEVAADEKKEPANDNAEENGDEVTPPPFKEPGNEKK